MIDEKIDRGIEMATMRPASQEDQDHERREHGRDGAFFEHAVDGGLHEDRLIEHGLHLKLRGHLLLDLSQPLPGPLHHVEGGGAAALEHGEQR